MSLQLHRPDGKGGFEVTTGHDAAWRSTLRSSRWGASLKGGRLPLLSNPEMNPTSTARSVAFWVALATITFAVIVVGYLVVIPGGAHLWSLPAATPPPV